MLQGKQQLDDKATLIKEKHFKRKREVKTICNRDMQISRQDRQTQCTSHDGKNIERINQDVGCGSNKSEVWSCNVQSQFKSPVQTTHCYDYDYWDQQKYKCPCNEHIKRDRCYTDTKTIYASKDKKLK